jgi:hypothetical protein
MDEGTVMPICCGCHLSADYGTSIIEGDGSQINPYSYSQVDPTFDRPAARFWLNANQSIPNSSATAVTWTTFDFNSGILFNAGAPTRMTVPIAGFYMFGTGLQWAQANAIRETFFRLNGTTELHRQTEFNASAVDHYFNHNYQWYFNVGDYIEVMAFQNSGSSLNLLASASNRGSFWGMYLGKKI